jgi:hypothetical protein
MASRQIACAKINKNMIEISISLISSCCRLFIQLESKNTAVINSPIPLLSYPSNSTDTPRARYIH